MRMTPRELLNREPGICISCGKYCQQRNRAGQCAPCYDKTMLEYKARLAKEREMTKKRHETFWRDRGIHVGERVQARISTLLGGEHVVEGVAKVGKDGPYVWVAGVEYPVSPNLPWESVCPSRCRRLGLLAGRQEALDALLAGC